MSDCDCHKKIAILEAEIARMVKEDLVFTAIGDEILERMQYYSNEIKQLKKGIKRRLKAYGQHKIPAAQLEAELWELIEGEK